MEKIESPFKKVIEALTGGVPVGVNLDGVHSQSELSEDDFEKLQNWCSCSPTVFWATGISIIDAAEIIVSDAISNANITTK